MTEQDYITTLIETEQRSKTNLHRIDSIEHRLEKIENEQKAIYSIATSVEVIAQRITHIEEKVDDTNNKVDTQIKTLIETENKLSEKISETETMPYKQLAKNVNNIKISIITAVCSLIISGVVGCVIAFGK